ncbi:VC0807 family protein [Sphaerisporangium perillae]|uniref:VC0807 family protein n=1 Tax=Sphaerisporangium perillae TaxID=2935860 RepID=UPI00200BF24E|nr:VC0807 family protein [Sphaerisporangium perillae]
MAASGEEAAAPAGHLAARSRRRRQGLVLVLDLAIPVGLYYVLRASGAGYQVAALVSSLVPGISAVADIARGRRPDGVAVFMTVMMLGSAAVSLLSGSPRFIFARDGWLTVVTGVWMLLSARGDHPLTLPFARALLEGRVGPGRPSWDVLWVRAPRFARLWRVCTVIWGVGFLLDAAFRVYIAYALPLDVIPGLNIAQYFVFLIAMQVVTNLYLVPAGLYNPYSRLYEYAASDGGSAAGATGSTPGSHPIPG